MVRNVEAVANLTVVVTAYNHEKYIRQCLDSICDQIVAPAKLIVINDASQDRTAKFIDQYIRSSDFPITFISNENNFGVCKSLNIALKEITTPYYIHISGDDWMEKDRVKIQYQGMANAPGEIALGVSSLREVDIDGELILNHDYSDRLQRVNGVENFSHLLPELLKENIITAPSVILRTSAVLDVGAYDEELMFEDYDLWLRLARKYSLVFIPGIVTNYRVIGNSMSRNPSHYNRHIFAEAQMLLKQLGRAKDTDETIRLRVRKIITTLAKNDSLFSAMKLWYKLILQKPMARKGE